MNLREVFFEKIILSLLWCGMLFFTANVHGQSTKIQFSGRVIDQDTHRPIPYANVRLLSLPDSTFVGGIPSSTDGSFRLSVASLKSKNVLLHVSCIGYISFFRSMAVSFNKSLYELKDIKLSSDEFTLDEMVVVGKAPLEVTEEDTTVFNASAYRTPDGGMLEDLVKQLPGGEISTDGKLLIHGKEVKKILVDGKEFFSDDPKVALKNLPVEMVEKLKAYERKSDLARLTGIDDGEEEMILDLSVKKGMKQGWMENFMGGLGSKDRYEVGNTLNRIREKSQFTMITNLNNTNNKGFSEFQEESSSATGNLYNKAGLTSARSLGVNFSNDWERVKLRSNIQYSGSDHSEDNRVTVDNFLRKDRSISYSMNHNRSSNHNLNANAFLEWKIDTLTNLVFRPQYRTSSNKRENNGSQESWANDTLINQKISTNGIKGSQNNLDFMLQVNRKLNQSGRNIALKVDYGKNISSSDRNNLSTIYYTKSNTQKVMNQRIDDATEGFNYRLQLVYVEPLPWTHFLQFRYSYQYKTTNSDRYVYNWDEALQDFVTDYDTLSSNSFENQYSNHLFNVSVRTNRKMYNYNIGFDLEPQKSTSASMMGHKLNHPFTKSVLNFSPTVNFRYKFSKRTRLQLVYRGKSKQANMRDLQPVADMTNPLNIRMGNPLLKPSYTNTFTFNYNSYNQKHQRNIVASLLAENVINNVTSLVVYDSETGVRTTSPVNMDGNWRAMGSFSLNTSLLGSKSWLFRSYSYAQYSNQNGYTTLNQSDPLKSSVKHFSARQNLQLTWRTSSVELAVRGELTYNNAFHTIRQSRSETFDYRSGGDIRWYLPWGIELHSDATYFLRSGYKDQDPNRLIWNCVISKAFLKRKQLLLRFKVYDLLQEENSLTRSIQATAIRDTESNVLGRYFMLHAIVRLNMMGKKL